MSISQYVSLDDGLSGMCPWPEEIYMFAPESAHEVVRQLESRYESMLESGKFEPFLYPWSTLGAGAVILFLLLDHRKSWLLQKLRLPVWLFNVVFSFYTVLYQRARNPAGSLGIGIISGWSILWTGVLLIFDDCQEDYMRIERRGISPADGKTVSNGSGRGISTATEGHQNNHIKSQLKSRQSMNGHAPTTDTKSSGTGEYFWQHYPTGSLLKRLDWVIDAFTTFRGTAWSWRVSGLAPPPEHVTSSPADPKPTPLSRPPIVRTFTDRRAILRHNTYLFVRNYLILDMLKSYVSHDRYFWGNTDAAGPAWLTVELHEPAVILLIRLLVALGLMKFALELIFSLGPIFFIAILPSNLFPVRAEAWVHPDQFGSISFVFTKGLAGWWGGFWHQTFRKGFEAPAQKVTALLGLEPRSVRGKTVQLFVAFTLSGLLHACGSTTQIGETSPLRGPFLFFITQAVGISLEMGMKMVAKQRGWDKNVPDWLGKLGNFVFAHAWLYLTAPLMVEDFAKGGVWLFEPVPFSIFRGPLGWGDKEDGFWRWHGTILSWHRGDTWWKTGIAL
ncbi:MBOAT-like protein 3 [Elsinoe fawcettii]|nr:MBOAT-like protein 3 [Elsinoe fawcettii]